MTSEWLPMTDPRPEALCYVDGCFAYFTTQPLEDQWGDDWNDAPYECNAGEPYRWHFEHDSHKTPWTIKKVAFDVGMETPSSPTGYGGYSVEDINAKQVPWLRTTYSRHKVAIFAGVDIEEFAVLIREAGGQIYTLSR